MSDYGWQGKHENGVSKGLRRIDLSGAALAEVQVPTSAMDQVESPYRARCTAPGCGKRFKAAHVIATHFRAKHVDLNTETDAWKQYVELL